MDVIVIGAGAAGLMAAIRAAERGRDVLLLEKNRKPGVKILMSGGTRCNITQNTDSRGIVEAFGDQGPFLHSALAALTPQELVAWFEAEGVATKVEPTGKIFPESDRALDVLNALRRRLERSGARLALQRPVRSIRAPESEAGHVRVETDDGTLTASSVIVTSGGQSYPGCGTTGDGYAWARELGHDIAPAQPALVPLTTEAAWVRELQGVTVPEVELSAPIPSTSAVKAKRRRGSRRPSRRRTRGSLLFAHFGLTGPAPLDLSRCYTLAADRRGWSAACNFLPGATAERLEQEWVDGAAAAGRRSVAAELARRLPRRLAEALVRLAGLPPERRLSELARQERRELANRCTATSLPIVGTRGFAKAEVTTGGVTLDSVDSRSMESRKVPGLYFAGEILDLDGPIGGYNFQAAFSTGWLAGSVA